MARKLREWHPDTTYHVTARGNRKSNIFKDRQDFMKYLRFLTESLNHFKDESPYELLSYCLMDNHVHLLIHTSTKPLGPLMQKVHTRYAIHFNKKYECTGHLFEDRFYTVAPETTAQLLAMSSYIHLNPVSAKMVKKPEDYPYSSYKFMIGINECDFVDKEKVLAPFQSEHKYRFYKDFVEMMIAPAGETP